MLPRRLAPLVAASLLAACLVPREAQAETDVVLHVEILLGRGMTDSDDSFITGRPDPRVVSVDGAASVYGVRGGVELRRWLFTGDLAFSVTSSRDGRLERRVLDLEAARLFGRPGEPRLLLHAGTGLAFSRATDAQEAESRSGRSLVASAGVGGHVPLAGRFFLRPDLRFRSFSGPRDDVDWEVTVGFGFTFGGGRDSGTRLTRPSN